MKKIKLKAPKRVISLLCAASLLSPVVFSAVSADDDAKVQSYEAQLADLQAEQNRLSREIDALRNEAAKSREYKESLDRLAYTAQMKITLSNNVLEQLSNQISSTEKEIEETQAELDATMEKYLQRVKESYEDGTATYLELILGSESLTDFLTRLDRINSIMEYDRNLMRNYEKKAAELDEKKASLEESKEAEKQTNETLSADKEQYSNLSAEQESYINSITKTASDKEALYAEITAAEAQLNAELESYIKEQQAQSQVIYTGEGFIRPISPGTGYVSSGYGWRELWGNQDFHAAVDVACPTGTPILASSAGQVIRAEWHWSYGYYILVDHGNGISTLYAHCSALLVSVGQMVNQGDNIALVGATGQASGSHVHVEVRVNGERVDPNGYIGF